MKTKLAICFAILLSSSTAYTQLCSGQGWQDNQCGGGFNAWEIGQLGVGPIDPPATPLISAIKSQNGPVAMFTSNTSGGGLATSGFLAQAATSDAYATPPYIAIGPAGRGYTTLTTQPYLAAGIGLMQYVGSSNLVTAMQSCPTCAWQLVYDSGSSETLLMQMINNGALSIPGFGGGGVQCVKTDNVGNITPGSCTAGTVTSLSALSPVFVSASTGAVQISEQGAIVSGSTSTTAQNLGAISTAPLGCSTSGGVCTVDGLTLAGGLHFDTGTGTETLGSFACGANTFVSSSSTSGLACTQPAFSNLNGSATCSQLPALTGDVTASAGSCATTIPTKGKVLVSATDPTIDYLDTKFESTSGNIAVTHITGPPEFVNLNVITAGLFDGPQTASVSANYVTYAPGVTGYGTFAIPYSTARTTADIQNAAMEVPVGFAATKQRVIAKVTSNSLSSAGGGSTVTSCQSTQNGSGTSIFAGGGGGIPNASTGLFDSGVQSVSSSAATDTWGIACGGSSPLSGTITMTVTVMVWR